ncbi:genetic competence negative regulator [Gorillibacterium timonense]|uniref:genetic competence negative regulator n=1 Tax=Gorillibacterium timonense TaxID=1689269 RepID=UPI00071CE693|nr:genetic competence negative regulator [Gorillibacterium timonense]
MKIERLGVDKIRIFLTFDDLTERGIKKDDMWREVPKVHELFSEMMEQAYSELGFDASGPLAVEVFALPAQGMVVIVTRSKNVERDEDRFDDEDGYEMEVTLEHSDVIVYAFRDLEDLIRMAKVIQPQTEAGGTLYSYKDRWVLLFDTPDMDENEPKYQALIAILSEYGEATSVTQAVLEEYGKTVIVEDAVHVLCTHFS